MKMKNYIKWLSVVLAIGLGGCVTTENPQSVVKLTDMQSVALCRDDEQAKKTEKRITAEYGFQRFAKNSYHPVLDERLFGHKIRVIELGDTYNKIYAEGNPREFGHHFGLLLEDVTCDKKSCQAPIAEGQTLHIYKFKLKKSKDTTVMECTKPLITVEELDTDAGIDVDGNTLIENIDSDKSS